MERSTKYKLLTNDQFEPFSNKALKVAPYVVHSAISTSAQSRKWHLQDLQDLTNYVVLKSNTAFNADLYRNQLAIKDGICPPPMVA